MTDDRSADALNQRLFAATTDAMDVFTVYIGDRLGYYRLLVDHEAQTPEGLASLAGTTERYTREWLEQQAVTGILEVDDVGAAPADRRYSIAPGHAEALTDRLSLAYITAFVRMVAAAGVKAPEIVDAHRSGQGVSWAQYGLDMRESQGDMNRPFFASLLGNDWFPSVPALHDRLSRGGRVADIGFGMGWSAIALAKSYPGITVDGFDIDEPSVDAANRNAEAEGVAARVHFHVADAGQVDHSQSYDVVTAFECIHDLPYPVEVLGAMKNLSSPDGMVVVMDEKVGDTFGAIGDDIERVMYGFSNLICLPDGMAHPNSAGTGTVMRHSQLTDYARQAGFQGVEVLPIETDLWRFYSLT